MLGLLLAGALSACAEVQEDSATTYEPATLRPIAGSEAKRVVFSAEGARRVGLRTGEVRRERRGTSVPHAALLYGADGDVFVYANPRGRSYVRRTVAIRGVRGDRALLSAGPPARTRVVTVGAAEVYGTEFEVAH